VYLAIARGDAQAAQEAARREPPPWREMLLAIAAQISPDRAAADAALAKALADQAWRDTSPYAVAQAYALRGDSQKTVEWLARAPAHDILFLLADPILLHLRHDPRLIAFCSKTGLPAPDESEARAIGPSQATVTAVSAAALSRPPGNAGR
jgi:hypothetical protein